MHALLSVRQPQVSARCRATYTLLAAYAQDGGIELDPYVNEGATSALLIISDAMEMLGVEGWDHVDRKTVEATCDVAGCADLLPFFVRTLVAFRRWLVSTGRASDAHLAELERLAAALPTSDTMSGAPIPRASRTQRRAARSDARRMDRRRTN